MACHIYLGGDFGLGLTMAASALVAAMPEIFKTKIPGVAPAVIPAQLQSKRGGVENRIVINRSS